MEETEKPNQSFMLKLSAVSRNWVKVENELAKYLPPESEMRQGLDVMAGQFTTFGTADVMVANVTWAEAQGLADRIAALGGVQSVAFDDTADHYHNVSTFYSVTFDYDENGGRCLEVLNAVQFSLSGYDLYIVAVIVVAVLLLTFVTAMILNMGTNFLLGTISFVSNSVTSILQLALSLGYAVILCNRFKEEHRAMLFMQFRIGPDMAVCLIKAIAFAPLSVFAVMPGLLVAFAAHYSNDCPYVYGYDRIEMPKPNDTQIAENMIKDNFTSLYNLSFS